MYSQGSRFLYPLMTEQWVIVWFSLP